MDNDITTRDAEEQARTLRRLGTAREVALPFLFLAVLCSFTWLGDGMMHHDVALLLVNAVGVTGAAVALTTALQLRAGKAGPVPANVTGPVLEPAMAAAPAA